VLVALGAGAATLHVLGPPPARRAVAGTKPAAIATPPTLPPALDTRRRVAILLDGIGLSEADSRHAIEALPGAVSFAVSPYAAAPDALLDPMRQHGHEYLISLPLEPAAFPLTDAGPHALLTGAPQDRNDANLAWTLGRITGEAGATAALDGQRGERFAAVPTLFNPVLAELARRGLFYIDPRPGAPPSTEVAGRSVDLVLDDPPDRADIDLRLHQLEQIALDKGAAMGLAGPPRPVLIDRLAAWSAALDSKGLVLVPVSRLVRPKATADLAADLPAGAASPR
jgi:polysaccharide deacetylase 2 family uncharacterized protein YibQ